MTDSEPKPVQALIVAVPETAGSALYGMLDVLSAAGNLWEELVGAPQARTLIRPRIVSPLDGPFTCGNGIPVTPHFTVADDPHAAVVILPEMWLSPQDDMRDRYPDLMDWIRRRYAAGAAVYTACSGAVMLAATGLLDGREATSHWGYAGLFRRCYPRVQFRPEPNLVFADAEGRMVTAGGATSWHDLAIHIISRHCGVEEAMRIAKVYLMKWHDEGQLPYVGLVRREPHADAVVRRCEDWMQANFRHANPVEGAVAAAGIPERSLKRRFKKATGMTLIDYVQNIRVEEAKRQLEGGTASFEQIAADLGYENVAFFRRLFKRRTGLTPAKYRRMFGAFRAAGVVAEAEAEPAP